jgi:hypothetical protein
VFASLSEFVLWLLVAVMEYRAKRVQMLDFVLIFAAGWFLSESSALHDLVSGMASGAGTGSGSG